MTWDRWRGSKSELAKKVKAYADSVGLPYSEVLLTLLHTAIQDIGRAEVENDALLAFFHDFGGELRRELRRRGWTQQELADRSGVSRATICKVTQKRRNPSMATASVIMSALEER